MFGIRSILRNLLALLDYVSRAHGMGSLSVSQLSQNYSEQIPSKFQLLLPLGHPPRHFLNFWKKKCIFKFFRIFFRFRVSHVNLGPYGSQKLRNATPPSNDFLIFSNFFWIFFWVVLTKVFWIFEILSFWFFRILFSFSLTWDPMAAKNFKMLLLPQSLLNLVKLFLNFLLSGPDKSTVLDFWNFELLIFHNIFLFSLSWDPMEAKTSKRYSSLKSRLNLFKLSLNFLLSGPHKSTV